MNVCSNWYVPPVGVPETSALPGQASFAAQRWTTDASQGSLLYEPVNLLSWSSADKDKKTLRPKLRPYKLHALTHHYPFGPDAAPASQAKPWAQVQQERT